MSRGLRYGKSRAPMPMITVGLDLARRAGWAADKGDVKEAVRLYKLALDRVNTSGSSRKAATAAEIEAALAKLGEPVAAAPELAKTAPAPDDGLEVLGAMVEARRPIATEIEQVDEMNEQKRKRAGGA